MRPSTSTFAVPRVAAVGTALPPRAYPQQEITAAIVEHCLPAGHPGRRSVARIAANCGVRTRHLVLPLERYPLLGDFTETNDIWLQHALDLAEQALRDALDAAAVAPDEVDLIASTTVTGLAVPSLEARLARRVGLRQDVRRVPLFGLGCAAGAAGTALVADHLRAWPDQVAVLLAVELCSLTFQRRDLRTANHVATSLFGDGAAALVVTGGGRARAGEGGQQRSGPELVAARSHLPPDTTDALGWHIGADGFRIVLSSDLPGITEEFLPKAVHTFLADHGLRVGDIGHWICHPGGPKILDAVSSCLGLPGDALDSSRALLARAGNLSSASVLHILQDTMTTADPPAPGTPALMLALGPGLSLELVLLRW